MKKYPTQIECKLMWLALFHGEESVTIEAIDEIDNLTPWSEVEPQWWLDMMHYRKILQDEKDLK